MNLRAAVIMIGASVLVAGVLTQVGAWKVDDRAEAAQAGPTMLHSRLDVRTAVAGLALPTSIAFLGPNDLLVLEKDSGKVKRVVGGAVQSTVLDLSVNNFSERGLLGIALHPDFPVNPGVYLYWTCRSAEPPDDPFRPEEQTCSDANMFGLNDSSEVLEVPLLGNRVDRFLWNGSALVFQQRLATFLAFQNDAASDPPGQGDAAQPARGNHDGGVIASVPTASSTSCWVTRGAAALCKTCLAGPSKAAPRAPCATTSSAALSPMTRTSPGSSSASTTTARPRATTPLRASRRRAPR